ncbi:arginine--tRNA ligase [Candidatus Saccharibacteria bacterium]|nr:arginine--tRNA ligase [Candidatus Saccharibacteria bacterium]
MEDVKNRLKEVIKESFNFDVEPEVTVAPGNVEADFSSNVAMQMARELHKAPFEIAEQIAEKMSDFKAVAMRPGFLNFISPDEYFVNIIKDYSNNFDEKISCDKYLNENIICEYSDPNPFKVLHVGHLYTSVVGDSISRLYEYAGAKVIRANFGGDVGLHVAKTVYILRKGNNENLTIEKIAKAYVEGTRAYEEDEKAKKEITELNKEIYRINKENIREGVVAEIYWRGRELSYQYFDDFYAGIGVKFDKYYPESSVSDLGLSKVKEQLDKGVYEMSNGAVVFNGEKFGLHTRVFINNEGVPTYEAKDVGLIFTKWADYHFDKSIMITGNEQLDYMKVVLKSVEQYAPDLVEKTSHLTHGMVKLPGNVKMSSRKGNFLKAVDVLEMISNNLAEMKDKADKKVVLAATKYSFLKSKLGGDIIFDPKESVSMTGNSGVYLLYSAVRAKKILSKIDFGKEVNGVFEMSEHEKELAKKVAQYKDVLVEAVDGMSPHTLCNYLYSLSQEFSRFYENVQVAGSEFEVERGGFVKTYYKIMEHGLKLLGIEIPEEM